MLVVTMRLVPGLKTLSVLLESLAFAPMTALPYVLVPEVKLVVWSELLEPTRRAWASACSGVATSMRIAAKAGRRVSEDLLPKGLEKFARLKSVMRPFPLSSFLLNQPKVDESHETVDESSVLRNLRSDAGNRLGADG